MKALGDLLQANLGKVYTAASAEIRLRGDRLYQAAVGSLDPEGRREGDYLRAQPDTRFDLASLTKLFTATAFFRLVDAGRVTPDAPVQSVLPGFSGFRAIRPYPDPLVSGQQVEVVPQTDELAEAGSVTFRHLLTHSSGLPAWINLREADDEAARLEMCLKTPFAYLTGTRAVYSDVGFILLGLAIERLADMTLDEAIQTLVQRPLNLSIRYGPIGDRNVAPTEFCAWRQRRLVGEVHDENAATLHGVAGHAGLFGTAADMASLGQLFLEEGGGLLSPGIVREATHRHIADRGLGWLMYSPDGSPGGHSASGTSFGHTGFTGTSLWIDPPRQLVCALLTNRVFFGRDPGGITQFRSLFHDTLFEALEDR
jgi:CubicO group peptidase (beta-lactamase class C family)